MIKTEYICDRCEHTQKNPSDMWTLGVTLQAGLAGSIAPKAKQLWCRDCVEKVGYLNNYAKDLEAKARGEEIVRPTPPTFEDLIRELVEEIVEEREDG